MTLLTTHQLSKNFGGLHAVEKVDFALDPGEIRAIIGPNGAGKTTFVSLICGRIAPTTGTIRFDDSDITREPAHVRVGLGIAYTFQITSIFANLSCYDNVVLAKQNTMLRGTTNGGSNRPRWSLNETELRSRTLETLAQVGLRERADEIAGNLAYGHQRLLEVAMGLALDPRLLILDEPTQGLSDAEIVDFCALVRRIAKDATVLLIEHNMHVVMQLADRITVLANGSLLAEGTPAAIRANHDVQQAYLGN